MSIKPVVFAVTIAVFAFPAVGAEQTPSYPKISGSVAFELENNANYNSDDATNEFNSLSTKIEPAIGIRFTPQFSVNTTLTFEPVQDPAFPGEDRFFDNQGLILSVLTANYDTDRFSLYGGKFGPYFGTAWDISPGLFGADLAKGYELGKSIGLGGSVTTQKTRFGTHALSVDTFFLDSTRLSETAFTRAVRTRERDGGPGNTGDLGSVLVGLNGQNLGGLKGLNYHLSYLSLGNETAAASDESRIGVGANYQLNLTDKWGLFGLVEYVNIDNADGTNDQDRYYLTGAAQVSYDAWNIALSYTDKETEPSGGTTTNEAQFKVSAGYVFGFGLGLDLGWTTVRNDGIDTDTFGTKLSYTIEF
ncbi:MAG: hypothetical protein HOB79_04120 [Rhodospirillaceae bacterium]|jgi:hypothetical protein|nr:hypothetical protein [Rhodospirillales bacterium]MBT3907155.1 hypothetical protein [Rhodospirillaceae bacterium]MBT4700238.1 hypothetical protein [Rhodospirillaceae bacterium]MBT5032927.1 hypothetical protein [Rhodospirillaceae bacterium]MBT6219804.1 hypothetical protein [Rhodospirillaceae bacterium]